LTILEKCKDDKLSALDSGIMVRFTYSRDAWTVYGAWIR